MVHLIYKSHNRITHNTPSLCTSQNVFNVTEYDFTNDYVCINGNTGIVLIRFCSIDLDKRWCKTGGNVADYKTRIVSRQYESLDKTWNLFLTIRISKLLMFLPFTNNVPFYRKFIQQEIESDEIKHKQILKYFFSNGN